MRQIMLTQRVNYAEDLLILSVVSTGRLGLIGCKLSTTHVQQDPCARVIRDANVLKYLPVVTVTPPDAESFCPSRGPASVYNTWKYINTYILKNVKSSKLEDLAKVERASSSMRR